MVGPAVKPPEAVKRPFVTVAVIPTYTAPTPPRATAPASFSVRVNLAALEPAAIVIGNVQSARIGGVAVNASPKTVELA